MKAVPTTLGSFVEGWYMHSLGAALHAAHRQPMGTQSSAPRSRLPVLSAKGGVVNDSIFRRDLTAQAGFECRVKTEDLLLAELHVPRTEDR